MRAAPCPGTGQHRSQPIECIVAPLQEIWDAHLASTHDARVHRKALKARKMVEQKWHKWTVDRICCMCRVDDTDDLPPLCASWEPPRLCTTSIFVTATGSPSNGNSPLLAPFLLQTSKMALTSLAPRAPLGLCARTTSICSSASHAHQQTS